LGGVVIHAAPPAAGGLAGLGVDFVGLSSKIWLAEDPAGQIAGIGAALRKARSPA
jgi:hypothetical protein